MNARPALRSCLLAAALLGACAKPTPYNPAREPAPPASPAVALAGIAGDFWDELARRSPLWATSAGDRRRDAELDDPRSTEARRHLDALFALRVRLDSVDAKGLGAAELATAEALREHLDGRIESETACKPHLWQVDPLDGYQVRIAQLPTHHSIRTREDAANLETRFRATADFFRAHVETLREGMATGWTAPRPVVERLLAQLEGTLTVPAADGPHAKVVLPHQGLGWHMEEVVRVRKRLVKAVEEGVYPGLTAYRDFVRDELLPKSRSEPGASALPGGPACYQAMIRLHTGTTRTPGEIHRIGVEQVASIEAEMLAIARRAGVADVAAYIARAGSAAGATYTTREEIVEHNRAIIARASASLVRAFRRLPVTPLEVRPIESFREKDASRGQYHHAPPDGSRPAIYFVNTLSPETQNRYATAALAAHEALPGHHLQIALAQETPGLPRFQRDLPPTVYVEGWGLYSERLADELGLFADDAERFGMLDAQRLRAVRLVVDSGIHGLGWTRDRAVEYQQAHGAVTRAQAERAIDRYITWPGQALAYMTGQLEIQALRRRAEDALGASFDLREFHDRVLRHGGVPVPVVRREVESWIADARSP